LALTAPALGATPGIVFAGATCAVVDVLLALVFDEVELPLPHPATTVANVKAATPKPTFSRMLRARGSTTDVFS
jgi:hypothetical protein